jgi:hypothetical protein
MFLSLAVQILTSSKFSCLHLQTSSSFSSFLVHLPPCPEHLEVSMHLLLLSLFLPPAELFAMNNLPLTKNLRSEVHLLL